ncbi:ATPase or kinase [Candidatus Terasakiella magnetica]|uniref:tRNA threonylcarbamoyladenosine biosynthesis protein TsaE n=1 Tax=Candidatus Terasakiella magnetica TaxID=1867952 RepID=A0A1C3REE0_9PROT|nr:tRNA (adenosine(37)-N6)-threonylcarbamoyltransferase complex ATPase subunit type 1 TsaE [Candidatus Terasakiella magnetica]SCA55598.1 ATPase or kinase [Candidatus Terasakiella magnetica]
MIIEIHSQLETEELARKLAYKAMPGDVIALHGNLGVGKSVFARAFVRALTTPDEEVPSPTFTLVQIYDAEFGELYHFDMYRLDQPDDCLELGIEEAFSEGVSLIEWPGKIGNYLPWDCLNIKISHGESGEMSRHVELSTQGNWDVRIKELSLG